MKHHTLYKDLKSYLAQISPGWFLLAAIAAFLAYGARMLHFSFGLDTNTFMDYYTRQWNQYLSQSRFGINALKFLFGLKPFSPFYSELLTFLMLILQGVAGGFLMSRGQEGEGKNAGALMAAFTLLFVSHPVWSEQYYFTLQSFEVSFGVVLTFAGCALIYEWAEDGRIPAGAVGIILLAFVYGIYQSFVPLSAAVYISLLFLDTYRGKREKALQKVMKGALAAVAALLLYFAAALLIKKLTGNDTSYISDQIRWGHVPFSDIFANLKSQISWFYLGGRSVFYSAAFLLLCAGLMVAGIIAFRKGGIICPLSALFLCASPMLLPGLLGSRILAREDFVVPYVSAFAAVFLLAETGKAARQPEAGEAVRKPEAGEVVQQPKTGETVWRLLYAVCAIALFFLGSSQLRKINTLWTTAYVTFEQDQEFARVLLQDMRELTGEKSLSDYLIVIVGDHEVPLNGACVKGDLIGRSAFATNAAQPSGYLSTGAVDSLYTYMGFDFCKDMNSDIIHSYEEAVDYARANMPCWPQERAMVCIDNIIIVRFD